MIYVALFALILLHLLHLSQRINLKGELLMHAYEEMEKFAPPVLNEVEKEMAKSAKRVIMAKLDHVEEACITIQCDDGKTSTMRIPPKALFILGQALEVMARNRPILLLPEKREFGTRDAAEFLNVSRPFVIKEAESGRLKYRLVGTHRRFLYTDLLAYIKDMNTKQVALEQMAQNARKLGLKY